MNEKTYTQEEAEEMDELIHILRPAHMRAIEWMDQNQARTYRLIHCVETMMEAGEDNALWAYHRDQTRKAIAEMLKDDMNDAEGRRVIAKATQQPDEKLIDSGFCPADPYKVKATQQP